MDPASGEIERIVHFTDVDTMSQCEEMDVTATCRAQLCAGYCYNHYQSAPACAEAYQSTQAEGCPRIGVVADAGVQYGGDSDGGESDAGEDAGGGGRASGCGCAVIGQTRADSGGSRAVLAVALLFALGITQARSARRVRSLSRSQVEAAIVTL